MSLFQTLRLACPRCAVESTCELVHSVNVDRRPDLREQILDGSFQRVECPSCATPFRTEPEFTYLHQGARQFVSAWPAGNLDTWRGTETRALDSFDRFFGSGSPDAAARRLGEEMSVRVVFGWEALNEKLLAAQEGIDDVTLELLKIMLMRRKDAPPADADVALRLVAVTTGDNLVLGEFSGDDEAMRAVLDVPRAALAEIEADGEGWASLRAELTTGPFLDVARLIVEPALGV